MSKCSRPLTLILTIILSFSFLSVNSFAAESTNLVDGNLSNWIDVGETDSKYFQSANVSDFGNGYNYIEVFPSSKSVFLLDLTEFLKIGESYKFSFGLPTTDGVNNSALTSCNIAWGLVDGGGYTDFPSVGASVFEIVINNENKSNYLGKNTTFEFTYTQGFKNTYLALVIEPREDLTSYNYLQLYISDIKLERVASESEQKLDGVLGWLQELWNSIVDGFSDLGSSISSLGTTITNKLTNVASSITSKLTTVSTNITNGLSSLGTNIQNKLGEVITNLSSSLTSLGDRIQTKLGEVITNLSGVLNSLKESITTKLGEVITGLTGELRMLGDRIINYLLYLGPEVPENPFKTEESPLTKVQGYIDDVVNYINDFTEDMDDVIDSLSAGIKIFTEFVEENKWVMILVAVSLFLLVVGRFVGI